MICHMLIAHVLSHYIVNSKGCRCVPARCCYFSGKMSLKVCAGAAVLAVYAIAEARSSRSTIFCTQYQPEGWYTRVDPDPESQSPISEAIMDRIIHNSYEIMVEGRVSMRERKGLRAASLKNDKTDA